MKKALQTNLKRDKMERESGFEANSDGSFLSQLRTAQLAIEFGLLTGDVNAIAEAGAMLAVITDYYPWRIGYGE